MIISETTKEKAGKLVRLQPVVAETGVGHEGDVKGEGTLHLFENDGLYPTLLLRVNAEVEFVVYLENHLAADSLGLEALVDANHRHLDDVGGGALNGRIDGVTLSKTSDGGVVGVDIRQIATTAE